MKSAPQMLQLLREIDDLVSFAAGSSCSVSQELCLDWCQCQSGFHSPISPSETNPLGLLFCCPRTTDLGADCRSDLAQGWASSWWGCLEPLPPKVPSPITWPWLGDQGSSAPEWCAGCHAPDPEPQEIPSSALKSPMSWVLPKPGIAHWLQFPKLRCISSVLGVSIASDSLVSAEDIFDKVWRVPSDVLAASWLRCGSWFMRGIVR